MQLLSSERDYAPHTRIHILLSAETLKITRGSVCIRALGKTLCDNKYASALVARLYADFTSDTSVSHPFYGQEHTHTTSIT